MGQKSSKETKRILSFKHIKATIDTLEKAKQYYARKHYPGKLEDSKKDSEVWTNFESFLKEINCPITDDRKDLVENNLVNYLNSEIYQRNRHDIRSLQKLERSGFI